MCVLAAVSILATARVGSDPAMLWGLGLMIPSVILVVAAQTLESMSALILACAVCGLAAGMGYRGSLQVVNQIAPAGRRAEVVSSYFICGFSGNALPVIGIGVLSTLASSNIATIALAAMLIVFALMALVFGVKYRS
jgi:MFS family permease